jgi:hypothetical protein
VKNEPIFIAGCSRSGTTYLKTLIDTHPDIFIPTESLFIVDYLKYGDNVPTSWLRWFFFREPQLKAWYSGGAFVFKEITQAIRRVHEYSASEYDAVIWGQKTPRFIRHMNLIEEKLGRMKWILIFRDPRAVVASMLKSKRHTYSVIRACNRWLRDNQPIMKWHSTSSPHTNVLLIKYEELICSYDKTLENIFHFLKLDPIDLNSIEQNARVTSFSGSKFQVNAVRGGLRPQKHAIDKWESILNENEIAYIEHRCASEMNVLGYEPSLSPSYSLDSRWRRSVLYVNDLILKLKDVAIMVEYLMRWPEYLLHTGLRKLAFLCFSVLHKI